MQRITLEPAHTDTRGAITDLLTNEEINGVTLVTFRQGAVRGNHYHEHTVQWNYVISGQVLLVTQFPGQEREEQVLGPGDFVVTRAGEWHALKGVTEAEVLILTRGPRAGSEYERDTFRLKEHLIAEDRP